MPGIIKADQKYTKWVQELKAFDQESVLHEAVLSARLRL